MRMRFTDPVFHGHYTLLRGPFSRLQRYLRDRDHDTREFHMAVAKCVEFRSRAGAHEILFWVPAGFRPTGAIALGILAHEAVHGALFLLEHRGFAERELRSEALNYLTQFLVTELVQRLGVRHARPARISPARRRGGRRPVL